MRWDDILWWADSIWICYGWIQLQHTQLYTYSCVRTTYQASLESAVLPVESIQAIQGKKCARKDWKSEENAKKRLKEQNIRKKVWGKKKRWWLMFYEMLLCGNHSTQQTFSITRTAPMLKYFTSTDNLSLN